MTTLQAITAAARIASKATYSGRVVIERFGDGALHVAEYTDTASYNPDAVEVYSIPTSPYEPESAAALIREARAALSV